MHRHEHHLPERVRAQLLALGIPGTKHSFHELAGYFPGEFNIGATGMSEEVRAAGDTGWVSGTQ